MKRIKSIHITLLLVAIFLSYTSQAQNWPKIYGDNFNATHAKIEETYDHGLLISAYTYTGAGWPLNVWIIKTDINGNVLWEKQFGNNIFSNGVSDSKITSDNGIILAASTSIYSGNYDPTFIKLNVCGEIEWCKVLLSPDQNYGTGIIQLTDYSYIGMLQYYGEGEEYSNISLIKMDQLGEPLWIHQLAQEDTMIYNEEGYHLLETSESNCLISGRVFYPGMKPFWILTDTSGIQIWDLKWGGITGTCFQTMEFHPGIFYSIGYKIPPGFQNLPSIYKFNIDGNELDDYLILGDTIYKGGGGSILKINDSSLLTGVVWGSITPQGEIVHSELIQIDTLGNLENRRLLLLEDRAPSNMILTNDNKYFIAGNYVVDGNWDIYLWKMNADLEDDTLYTQPLTYDSLCPYPIVSDTVDLDCSLFVNVDEIPTKAEYESSVKIYPNPASDWITLAFPDNLNPGPVEIQLFNGLGQAVIKTTAQPMNRISSLQVSNLTPGLCFLIATDRRDQVFRGKFIKEF